MDGKGLLSVDNENAIYYIIKNLDSINSYKNILHLSDMFHIIDAGYNA